jgi:hypothetical protein
MRRTIGSNQLQVRQAPARSAYLAANSWVVAMPRNLSDEAQLFYEHAEWCSRQAEGVIREVREDFTRLAEKWLRLVRSYEIARSARSQSATNKQI